MGASSGSLASASSPNRIAPKAQTSSKLPGPWDGVFGEQLHPDKGPGICSAPGLEGHTCEQPRPLHKLYKLYKLAGTSVLRYQGAHTSAESKPDPKLCAAVKNSPAKAHTRKYRCLHSSYQPLS